MAHYKMLIDTAYVGQWDMPPGRDVTVEIRSVEKYEPPVRRKKRLPDGTFAAEPRKRIKITFRAPARKPWLAGPVSQAAIAGMYGPDTDDWIGKLITLYVDAEVTMGSTKTGGVRVRPQIPLGKPSADPLDRPVDKAKSEQIERAKDGLREPGED
jgi:hypothetical protein